MNEQQFKELDAILQTRVKYLRSWGQVALTADERNFTIKWFDYQGDPDKHDLFDMTVRPLKSIKSTIKEQETKLARDIPEPDRTVLKKALGV